MKVWIHFGLEMCLYCSSIFNNMTIFAEKEPQGFCFLKISLEEGVHIFNAYIFRFFRIAV